MISLSVIRISIKGRNAFMICLSLIGISILPELPVLYYMSYGDKKTVCSGKQTVKQY